MKTTRPPLKKPGVPPTPKKEAVRLNVTAMRDILNSRTSSDFYTFPAGKTKLVMTMNPPGSDHPDRWWEAQIKYYIPSATGDEKVTGVISPRSLDADAYCLVDAVRKALEAHPKRAMRELAGALKPKDQFLSNAFVLDSGEWQSVIAQFTYSVFKPIAKAIDAEIDPEDLADGFLENIPVVGKGNARLITVEKTGTGMQTRYGIVVTSKIVAIPEELLEQRVDLSQFCQPTSQETVEEALCAYLGVPDLSEIGVSTKEAEEEAEQEEVEEEEPEQEEIPKCFGRYDPKRLLKRGCKSCTMREECKSAEVQEDDEE